MEEKLFSVYAEDVKLCDCDNIFRRIQLYSYKTPVQFISWTIISLDILFVYIDGLPVCLEIFTVIQTLYSSNDNILYIKTRSTYIYLHGQSMMMANIFGLTCR